MTYRDRTPPLAGVLETVLYYRPERERETEAFYTGILGMRLIGKEGGRNLFFRAGTSLLLLFNAEATRKGGRLPPHGAGEKGHVCFQVPQEAYRSWKEHLEGRDIEILKEIHWPMGPTGPEEDPKGSSFYFKDPSGNLLEIADTDFWPP